MPSRVKLQRINETIGAKPTTLKTFSESESRAILKRVEERRRLAEQADRLDTGDRATIERIKDEWRRLGVPFRDEPASGPAARKPATPKRRPSLTAAQFAKALVSEHTAPRPSGALVDWFVTELTAE